MKILVIGGGGREHALVWKLRESRRVEKIWCAPGNGGIAQEAECVALDAAEVSAIVALAERLRPDLTVVGPEAPLVAGVADEFAKRGWAIAGPTKQAAQLEGSKVFAKEFLARHNIPTASLYGVYDSPGDAYSALCAVDWPVVVKADGLCAGKGVLVTASPDEATGFIERLMEKHELGAGGERVLMEEALEGEELSYIVLTDGERVAPLLPARDHKRVFDGNQGPNTGGMGAFTGDTLLPTALEKTILETVVQPAIRGLREDGIPYRGFLYFGLMLTAQGPKVLEFNCRMGDPEAQAIAARMDFDFAEALEGVARGALEPSKLKWKSGASVCVVIASGGYPGKFETGKRIEGIADAEKVAGVKVLHAGTKREGDGFVTSGGRVLGVTATGATLDAAVAAAYQAASKIRFEGMHYRKDIGAAASKRHVAS
ncbi:MAG TPA: phosphoribosylamine--glycine ligase [Candidatus Acidoferrales bacterium]|nr:phosphoribosylamine--glycine ligase [Candidatus Acidoferrales bacterium]